MRQLRARYARCDLDPRSRKNDEHAGGHQPDPPEKQILLQALIDPVAPNVVHASEVVQRSHLRGP
eukprot:7789621-Prorocentrum_lima.AAC.1